MILFERGVEPNELYTVEDFLEEDAVKKAFETPSDNAILTVRATYTVNDYLQHTSLMFVRDCKKEGKELVYYFKNYKEKMQEFFDSLEGPLWAIFLIGPPYDTETFFNT